MANRILDGGFLVEPASSGNHVLDDGVFVFEGVSGDVNVAASVVALTLTANAATVDAATNVEAATSALTLTAYNPAIQVGGDVNVQAGVVALSISTYSAAITLPSGDVEVSAGTAALSLSALAAEIEGVTGKRGGFGMTQAEQTRLERRQRMAWQRQARKVRMIREDDEIVSTIIIDILEDR